MFEVFSVDRRRQHRGQVLGKVSVRNISILVVFIHIAIRKAEEEREKEKERKNKRDQINHVLHLPTGDEDRRKEENEEEEKPLYGTPGLHERNPVATEKQVLKQRKSRGVCTYSVSTTISQEKAPHTQIDTQSPHRLEKISNIHGHQVILLSLTPPVSPALLSLGPLGTLG